MIRNFARHKLRKSVPIGGLWDFVTEPEVGARNADGLPLQYADRLPVPGCWEKSIRYARYRGRAWYRTYFETGPSAAVRLWFGGVSHTAVVFVDGKEVGKHIGAFTPFSVVLPDLPAGRHELVIHVDNSFDGENRIHLPYFDWFTYGGIIRPVLVEELPETYVERVHVTTMSIDSPARLQLDARFSAVPNAQDLPGQADVEIRSGDDVVWSGPVNVDWEGKQGAAKAVVELDQPRLWSPDDPHLYTVEVRIGEDDLIDRFGVRTVAVRGRELLLNGKPIKLKGFNRHEDHPDWGQAVPGSLMWRDLDIIEATGANFIRGSHYPNNELFLDFLDERGILFWEEATSWQFSAEQLNDPVMIEQELTCIDEMITAHYNHPSIIMWGILNECASDDPESRPAYETLVARIRELDATRPVTYATHRPLKDGCIDLVDIASFNWYAGWYQEDMATWPQWIDKIVEWLDEIGQGDKPIIFSEFGAGGIPGVHSFERQKWSEEYQADFLDTALRAILNHPRVVGAAIWQYCDIRTADDRFAQRPRTFNNKGVVDEYRRPKLAYEVVKRHYGG